MAENFIKSNENQYIIENIERIKTEIYVVKNKMNMLTNEYLLESCIYRLKALDNELHYYIKLAKQTGVKRFEKIS